MGRSNFNIVIVVVFLFVLLKGWAQAPLIYEHTYPFVEVEDGNIRNILEKVSADSLRANIEHLTSYHTRVWNSDMVYDVQDWLFRWYRGLDLDTVLLHDFKVPRGDSLYETSDNVIAVQRGVTYPDEYVVCGAHYDSYNNELNNNALADPNELQAPGADDNASGVSGIMETARLLSQYRFDRSIIYANWAAEEVGLHGSYAFAHDCAEQLLDIVGYFNLDMIGYLEEGYSMKVRLLYTGRDSLLANYTYNVSDIYLPGLPIWHGWLQEGADSDYSSFNRNGYSAVQPFEDTHHSSPFIHTPNDLLGVSVNNMEQVKVFTQLNVALVATLAGLNVTSVPEGSLSLEVFPNPASTTLVVQGMPLKELTVMNLLGQEVISKKVDGSLSVVLDVSDLPSNVYLVRCVSVDGKVAFRKTVVK